MLDGGSAYEASVTLTVAAGCQLALRVNGGGQLRVLTLPSLDPLLTCAERCSVALRPGEALRLDPLAQEEAGSESGGTAFVGYSGPACAGPGSCDVVGADGVIEVTARFTSRRSCSADGFCWIQPLPQGNQIMV